MAEKEIRCDFTEDRIFSKDAFNLRFLSSRILKAAILRKKFPWDEIIELAKHKGQKDNDASLYSDPFFTGTNDEIKLKISYQNLYQQKVCECCGGPLDYFPWEMPETQTLCKRCNKPFFDRIEKLNPIRKTYKNPKQRNLADEWWII